MRAMLLKLLNIVFFFSVLSQSLQASPQNLEFTFNGFYPPLTDISVQGISSVTPKGALKLTNITFIESGHAFYSKPIRFRDSPNDTVSSFSTTFVFAIHPIVQSLGADGMAFVIAPKFSLPTADPSQDLGLFNIINSGNDKHHVFAVEFDTVHDPFDPDDNHVGIDINSLKSVKTSPAGYWNENDQFNKLTLVSGKPMQVWVDYDGRTHQINVTMAPLRKEKPKIPLLSVVRDLSSLLLQDMFIGFSSATGSIIASEHFVLGWSFRVKGEAPLLAIWKLPKVEKTDWMAWFTHLLAALLIFGIFCTILLLVCSPICLVRCILRRRRKYAEVIEDWETEFAKNRMKFKDLYYATKGFKDNGLLGRGGFGSVYKGVMPKTQKEIAVKKVSNKSQQGLKEFVSEIASIGRMSHRNLVPLLGYCRRKDELLLVYDYMPKGSLDKYLHNSPEVALDWNQRIKIIKGVASALFFLHEEWEQVVIHRDIKSSNVLLDAEYNGRLGDFGLARLCGHGTDPETTNVAGTWGYLAPDHVRTGRATTATDVFAFGVLLLEVACGRLPIEVQDSVSGERVFLVDWVFQFWIDGNILGAKDPNLWYDYEVGEIEMVLKLGLLCSQSEPENIPTMRQVLHYLRGDVTLPNLSPSDLRGSERLLGIPEMGFSESSLSTGGSSITNSQLSGGR
ncbi:L-type lectin-domain containing receptor kinase IV.4 [Raphanus sativus]|uniref:non-specific serine/threonine protein kinase n=1 Tax=Raphanus sativus TaxID=3726 RepID=A0A9W3DD65_RAPSA|nr:L-type lectin-domain containing receptor kinase IV.4-like [Raphanus sativus]KAJ4905444.1 L-type lectin-domain containing receptor kinase IV.4 [Raphanus sativus]